MLLEHLKKFSVNPTGGLMLTKDIALYQETISAFNQPILKPRFEMLRQLGNLFIVRPEVLRSYMRDDVHLSKLDPTLLKPYLVQRSDYTLSLSKYLDKEFGISSALNIGGFNNTTGFYKAAWASLNNSQNKDNYNINDINDNDDGNDNNAKRMLRPKLQSDGKKRPGTAIGGLFEQLESLNIGLGLSNSSQINEDEEDDHQHSYPQTRDKKPAYLNLQN